MALLQAPVDKHPHGNCEPCQQQEIKELIGRVNLHVRVGNELLICLDECEVLSQWCQVRSHEAESAKLPFLETFYFTPLHTDISSSFPPRVRLPGRVGGAPGVTHIPAGDSTAAPASDMGEGLAAAQEGPFEFQPFWSCSLVLSRSESCMAGEDLSEGEMCSHQNSTFGAQCAKLDQPM